MKRNKAFCFLMSLVSILGSPRVSYGGLKTSSISGVVTDSNLSDKSVSYGNSKTGSVSGVVANSNLSDKSLKNENPENKNNKKKTMLKVILNKINQI